MSSYINPELITRIDTYPEEISPTFLYKEKGWFRKEGFYELSTLAHSIFIEDIHKRIKDWDDHYVKDRNVLLKRRAVVRLSNNSNIVRYFDNQEEMDNFVKRIQDSTKFINL